MSFRIYKCSKCDYSSNRKQNTIRHYKKHFDRDCEIIDNPYTIETNNHFQIKWDDKKADIIYQNEDELNQIKICPLCKKEFAHRTSFTRHFNNNRCNKKPDSNEQKKINDDNNTTDKIFGMVKTMVKEINELKNTNIGYQYNNSNNDYSLNTNVQNNFNNCKMITINYLNENYHNVMSIEKFKTNLQTNYQLTKPQAQRLVGSRDIGFNQFADEFINILNENHQKQITSSDDINLHNHKNQNNLNNEKIKYTGTFPILTTDSNLRTHNEKTETGWSKTTSINNIKDIFNICNEQVYYHTKQLIILSDRQRLNLYNRIRRFYLFQPPYPYQHNEKDLLEIYKNYEQQICKIKEEQYRNLIEDYTKENGHYIPLPL